MKIKSLKELEFLASLLDIKKGTISEILEQSKIFNPRSTKIYKIRNDLIEEGIFNKVGYKEIGKGQIVVIYKINHKKILKSISKSNPNLKKILEQAQNTLYF